MGILKDFSAYADELEKASQPLVDFFKKYCSPHDAIIVDESGVRRVSDIGFIPTAKQPD